MFVTWILALLILGLNVLAAPHFLLLLTAAVAAFFARGRRRSIEPPRSRILVAIPAHNEATGIANTVQSCRAAHYPADLFEVLVIADNCSDETAILAREAGARVLERHDLTKKSKGFAIEYLINSLMESGEFDRLDALVIIDADTTIDADLLGYFDNGLRRGRDWIQCYYSVANADQSMRTRLMTYAFGLYNGVLLQGLDALGLSAGFKGNGMCFSVRGLKRRPWKAHGLVEDMEYSWTLRHAGERIHFEPRARVYGAMLRTGGAAAAHQRRRWEFGRRQIQRQFLGRFLHAQGLSWPERLVSILELSLPPMAWLILGYVMLMVLNASAFLSPVALRLPLLAAAFYVFSCLSSLSLAAYGLSPFLSMGLPWRYGLSLAMVPVYVIWKIVVSLAGPPDQWIRTAREPQSETTAVDAPKAHVKPVGHRA
jgi:cellulose synthase/poly-beta-1,6-N-acetylglucosamine synthase-like glycosyltransferase